MILFAVLEALTFLYFGILFIYGNPNARPLIANALGLLLYGAALMALACGSRRLLRTNHRRCGRPGVFLLLYLLDWVSAYSQSTVDK